MVEWECLLVGGSFEELVAAGEPRIVAGQDDDGAVVFAVSAALSTALAEAERARLREVAAAWVQARAEDGETIGTEIAEEILSTLSALIVTARRQSQSVYCWVA